MSQRISAYDGNGQYAFVSYSHNDSRTVYSIIEQLSRMGYNVWYDEGIPLIADYGGVLYERIKNCSAFILFVSRKSVLSEDVEKEAAHAISFKKPIVQIVIDEDAELPSSIAYHLPKTKQYLSIHCEPKEFYSKLTAALDGCADQSGGQTANQAFPPTVKAATPSLHVGDKFTFGKYRQKGAEREPIEWRVLKVESDRALLLSEYAIDNQKYNEKWLTGTRWEICTLRKWLNETFMRTAFNEEEREQILSVRLPRTVNKAHDTEGDSTEDRIFCLSVEDAEMFFADDNARTALSTKSASSGIFFSSDGPCCWWLRTIGSSNGYAVFVEANGRIRYYGSDISHRLYVRPALYIRL